MIRLIKNTDNDSIFEFFNGSEDPTGWTEKSPAVWHQVKKHYYSSSSNYDYAYIKFENLSDRKWLFVMCQANTEYEFVDYYGWGMYCNVYDGLSRTKIKSGVQLTPRDYYEKGFTLKFYSDTILLFEFYPYQEDTYALEYEHRFGANAEFKSFTYNSRYYRDWQNKVTGTSWNYVGKVNAYRTLSQCSRQRPYLYDFYYFSDGEQKSELVVEENMKTLTPGFAEVGDIYYSDSISSFDDAESIYNSGTATTAVWSSINKADGVAMPSGRTTYYLGQFKTTIKITRTGVYSFRCSHDDAFAMKFDNQTYYLSGTGSNVVLFSDKTLIAGYYPITVYLQQYNAGHYMIMQWNVDGEGWENIPSGNQCLGQYIFQRNDNTEITMYAKDRFSASSYESFETAFENVTETYSLTRPHISDYQNIGSYGTYYAIKMVGYLRIDTPGEYVFSTIHDDEAAVNINGAKSFWSGCNSSTSNHQNAITFDESGFYPVTCYLSNSGSGNVYFQLHWKRPGGSSFDEIPESNWYGEIPYYEDRDKFFSSLKALRVSDGEYSSNAVEQKTFADISAYNNVSLTFSFSIEPPFLETEVVDEETEEQEQPVYHEYNVVNSTDFGIKVYLSKLVIWFKDADNQLSIPITEENHTYFVCITYSNGNAIVIIDDKTVGLVTGATVMSNNVFTFGTADKNITVSKFRLYSCQLFLDEMKYLYYRGQ